MIGFCLFFSSISGYKKCLFSLQNTLQTFSSRKSRTLKMVMRRIPALSGPYPQLHTLRCCSTISCTTMDASWCTHWCFEGYLLQWRLMLGPKSHQRYTCCSTDTTTATDMSRYICCSADLFTAQTFGCPAPT